MCLFTSTKDNVDIYWLNEVMVLAPNGPHATTEREAIISGLVRATQEKSTLTFVQRGELYCLKDRSTQWLSDTDWLTKKILNHPALNKYPRIEATEEKGKLLTRFRNDFRPDKASIADLGTGLSDVSVSCPAETVVHSVADMPTCPKLDQAEPIFSIFSLHFQEPVTQLFRISFRTKFGLHKYHSQITLDVEGPDLAIASILRDIARVPDAARKAELRQQMYDLSDNTKEPRYEIAIISHPSLALTIEHTENIKKPFDFKLDSKEIPIPSAASPTRGVFLDTSTRTFTVSAVATITQPVRTHSPEFLKALEELKHQLQESEEE
jgi:hypothetical protein